MAHGVDRSGAASGSGASDDPITEALIDAKGDLIAGSAADTPVRVAVGANETRLVADSAQTAGVKWVADTVDYVMAAKGDLRVGTAADTAAAQSVGTDGYALQAQSGTTTGVQYIPTAPFNIENGYLDWSVSGNVLTVAVKTWAGTDPSSTDPVYIVFRSATAGTGSLVKRKLTAATSIAINDTATFGTANSVAFRLWAVAFDDGGTVRLGLINCVTTSAGAGAGRDVAAIYPLAGWGIASSTLEADGSDSASVFYTNGAAVTSKAYATLGYGTWESGLATAGTWSAAPTRAQLWGLSVSLPGQAIQVQRALTGAVATGTTTVPDDDTIPQSGEGDQYMTQAVTPSSTANALAINLAAHLATDAAGGAMAVALFQDATANALAASRHQPAAANQLVRIAINHCILSQTSSSTTFKVRAGLGGAGTTTFNGAAGSRKYGGVVNSYLEVTEVMG